MRGPSFLTAATLAAAYRAGELTPVAVVEDHLARIAALDGALHAYVEVYGDTARAEARASAARFAEGRPRGPLDGVPVAVKDLIEIEGRVCTAGSAIRRGHVATRTAAVVERLAAAGAVVLGKVHTVEFAFGGWGTNPHLGAPRNPWRADAAFVAGGSSSGAAAAVAARLATLAVGTDTGGSVRVPAGFNGLVGLKTTAGRISTYGVTPLAPSLDTVGPIARTVADVAALFVALCGPDPRDPATAHVPAPDLSAMGEGVAGMTLGVLDADERAGIDAEMLAACDAAVAGLAAQGARVTTLRLPKPIADFAMNSGIMAAEAYALYGHYADDAATPMDPAVRARIRGGAVPARDYIAARLRAAADAAAMRDAMAGVDALVLPTAATPAIPLAAVDETTTATMLTRFVNQIGFCALAAPAGFSVAGLPLSVQVVCRPFEEATALRIGLAHERATDWAERTPPMAFAPTAAD